jgi:hypothetical protein
VALGKEISFFKKNSLPSVHGTALGKEEEGVAVGAAEVDLVEQRLCRVPTVLHSTTSHMFTTTSHMFVTPNSGRQTTSH